MGAPRQTRADRFKKREVVLRYRAFKDECRLRRLDLPQSSYHLIFVLPMPASWSKKKKAQMNGQPMQQKPDKDNLEKAVLDALFKEDAAIWDGRVTKYWGTEGMIIVREIEPPPTLTELLADTNKEK
jgi:Holliday junction resolvase RusA-like endonuclease